MARESTIGSFFFLENLDTVAVSQAFSAVTKGPTTSLTVAAALAGAAPGKWVRIAGSDMRTLDRAAPHRVISASASAIVVATDTSDETVTATAGTVELVDFVETCFTEFTPNSPEPGEVDVTTMCDTERRTVAGLSSPGSVSFGGPLDMTDTGVLALIAARKDGLVRAMYWQTRGGQAASMAGQVSSFVGAPQAVEAAVTFSGTFQIQDGPFYHAPLA
jgi:hypothetical protein